LATCPPRRLSASFLGTVLALLVVWLAGCASGTAASQILTIATFFPTSGVDAALGKALQDAVDLAVQQHSAIGTGYTLSVEHLDANGSDPAAAVTTLAADPTVMGIVGPLDSQAAITMLPLLAQDGVVTISPSATLPGLTQVDQAAAEGVPFAQLHPTGAPLAFFRLPETDNAAGKVAADVATAPTSAHGLGAQAIFLVDDGTASGKAAAAAFAAELKAKHGTVAGQRSVLAGVPDSAQSAVSAIVAAYPDLVAFAGSVQAGAELRGALALSGVSQLGVLAVGAAADDAAWSAIIGVPAAAANTSGILPAPDLAALPSAKSFAVAFQAAYPHDALPPQAALAYDATMDEIAAIQSALASGKGVTRAAVLAAVASAKYQGITGTLAFDKNGDDTTPLGFSLYTCDAKGAWHYVTTLKG
jgi:branched-chain amino acid transport system substrate-binding protein